MATFKKNCKKVYQSSPSITGFPERFPLLQQTAVVLSELFKEITDKCSHYCGKCQDNRKKTQYLSYLFKISV